MAFFLGDAWRVGKRRLEDWWYHEKNVLDYLARPVGIIKSCPSCNGIVGRHDQSCQRKQQCQQQATKK